MTYPAATDRRGVYVLSDGSEVRGRGNAEEAQAALDAAAADEPDHSTDSSWSQAAAQQGTVTEMQEIELRPGYRVKAPVVTELNPLGTAARKMD